jgi:hypothetical protein
MNECPYCGAYHPGTCHRVKSIEYFANGTIKKVKLNDYFQQPTEHSEKEKTIDASNEWTPTYPERESDRNFGKSSQSLTDEDRIAISEAVNKLKTRSMTDRELDDMYAPTYGRKSHDGSS